MDAGQDLDQRRFAGAVVADQRHDLAGMDVEIDVGQRRDRAEVLGDAAQAAGSVRPALLSASLDQSRHAGVPLPVRGSPGRTMPAGRSVGSIYCDAELLAAFGIAPVQSSAGGVDALVEDLGLDVLACDDRRHEELGRRVVERRLRLRRLALEQLHRDIGRRGRDDLGRLGDGVVLVARDDQLQRRDRRVVAGDRRHRIDAGRLEGRDRAAAGAVIGGHDAEDVGAEAGDLAARPFLRLRRRPVRRVELGQRLVAADCPGPRGCRRGSGRRPRRSASR